MRQIRPALLRAAAMAPLSLLATAAPAYAAAYDEATWVHTTVADDGAMTDWFLYRNTVVSLDDGGRATCLLPPGTTDARAGCHQVPSTDPAFLADLVVDRVLAGATLRCGGGAYLAAWHQVPNDPSHWCNAFPAEALTVRARIDGAGAGSKRALTWNLSSDASWGAPLLAFVVPPQSGASGPTEVVWFAEGPTRVTATLRNIATQSLVQVQLTVSKHAGCVGPLAMHAAYGCTGISQLEVVFDPKDNLHLPAGRFIGSFEAVAVDGAVPGPLQSLVFNVDISKQ